MQEPICLTEDQLTLIKASKEEILSCWLATLEIALKSAIDQQVSEKLVMNCAARQIDDLREVAYQGSLNANPTIN